MGNEGSTTNSHSNNNGTASANSLSSTSSSMMTSISSSSSSGHAFSNLEKFLGQVPNHQPDGNSNPHQNTDAAASQHSLSAKAIKPNINNQLQAQAQSQKGKKPATTLAPNSQLPPTAASSSPAPSPSAPSLSSAAPLSSNNQLSPAAANGGKDTNLSHVPSYSQLSNPSTGNSGPFPMPSSHLITKRLPLGPGEAFDAHFQEKHSKKKKLSVEDFELLKVVGKGSFGKVMQVKKKSNGKIFAMKVLKKDHLIKRKQIVHTKTERKILQEIKHPFIVSLKYAFQTDTKLYMVLDFFSGGELFFHLKQNGRFSEERAKFYAAEIVLALECLHKHQIVYRDLKPENVLLDDKGHIRLTDFGLSKEGVTNRSLTKTFCGTPEYLAPEMIHGYPYGVAIDWWSLGTILFEMLTGLPPFYDSNIQVMYDKIIRSRLKLPDTLSNNAKSLISALLEKNPRQRIGYERDADEIKAHPFFTGFDWAELHEKHVQPPFVPKPNPPGKQEANNVDEEFKNLVAKDTPIASNNGLLKGTDKINFPGFSYAGSEKSTMSQIYGGESSLNGVPSRHTLGEGKPVVTAVQANTVVTAAAAPTADGNVSSNGNGAVTADSSKAAEKNIDSDDSDDDNLNSNGNGNGQAHSKEKNE